MPLRPSVRPIQPEPVRRLAGPHRGRRPSDAGSAASRRPPADVRRHRLGQSASLEPGSRCRQPESADPARRRRRSRADARSNRKKESLIAVRAAAAAWRCCWWSAVSSSFHRATKATASTTGTASQPTTEDAGRLETDHECARRPRRGGDHPGRRHHLDFRRDGGGRPRQRTARGL